jgi:thiosulfate/3-mercaptopyruvate sulfurtransferase
MLEYQGGRHGRVRVSDTAVVPREPGFTDVKVHEPSWLGCAGVLSAPAGDEVFVDVGALDGQIAAMQARLRRLEAALQALQLKPAQ